MNFVPDLLYFVGRDTTEIISLGHGYQSWPQWAFRGPVFSSQRVDPSLPVDQSRLYLLLPKELLLLLYKRFAEANPSGVALATIDEFDDLQFAPEVSEAEREYLVDTGEVSWNVFDDRLPPHGRDPIKRYLPELFETKVLQAILEDQALDSGLRRSNRPSGDTYWCDEHHYRWSDWWLSPPAAPR